MRRADKRWVQLRAQKIAMASVADSLDARLIALEGDAVGAGLQDDHDVKEGDAREIATVLDHDLHSWLATRFS